MKNTIDEAFEHDLDIFSNTKNMKAPDFFYTSLKARMENETRLNIFGHHINPILVICALTLFLFINSILLRRDKDLINSNKSIESLAASYDQIITN